MSLSGVGDFLQGIGSVGQAIVILLVARIGANTFNSWRQQNLEGRRIDQAERILTATYDAKTALLTIRNSLNTPKEVRAAQLKNGSAPENFRAPDGIAARIVLDRIEAHSQPFKELNECRAMARALFGEDVEKAIRTLCSQPEAIFHAAEALPNDNHKEEMREILIKTINSGSENGLDNELNEQMFDAVNKIEDACLPVLRYDKIS